MAVLRNWHRKYSETTLDYAEWNGKKERVDRVGTTRARMRTSRLPENEGEEGIESRHDRFVFKRIAKKQLDTIYALITAPAARVKSQRNEMTIDTDGSDQVERL